MASATAHAADRGLPASPDAEKAILGAIILDQGLIRQEAADLEVSELYLDAHRKILRRQLELDDEGCPIDTLTLAERLGSHRELESVGGVGYLSSLTDGVPRRPSIRHYVLSVKEKARLRSIIHAASGVIAAAMDQRDTADEISQSMQTAAMKVALTSSVAPPPMFVNAHDFTSNETKEIDWLVDGFIEKGSNGFFCADPKGGKSFTTLDLAVSLAMGMDWLSFRVPRRARVAVVSREDNPIMTKRRLRRIAAGKSVDMRELLEHLWFNSREQTSHLMLDSPMELKNLIGDLRRVKAEFVILDVFNVLHAADENDNTQMRAVLNQVKHIQEMVGCQIAIIHHFNKGDAGQLTKRLRGAGAIAGFAEWMAGIEMADEDSLVRQMIFEIKGAESPKPVYYRIKDLPVANAVQLEVMPNFIPPKKDGFGGKRRSAKEIVSA